MMDSDLKARIIASISATNAEAKKYEISWFKGEDVADALHLGKTYRSIKSTLTSGRFLDGLFDVVEGYFLERLSKRVGLDVSEISEEGIARAIGRRAGFELRSLHDLSVIEEDLVKEAANRIQARMGWQFNPVVNTGRELADALIEKAAGEVEKKVVGLVLHNLKNVDQTVRDVKRWAAERVEARIGMRINDLDDPAKAQAAAMRWAENECRRRIGTGGANPSGLKMTKQAIKNRMAQRRFYAAHGDRRVMPSVKGGE